VTIRELVEEGDLLLVTSDTGLQSTSIICATATAVTVCPVVRGVVEVQHRQRQIKPRQRHGRGNTRREESRSSGVLVAIFDCVRAN
jgi:hypothetical protein